MYNSVGTQLAPAKQRAWQLGSLVSKTCYHHQQTTLHMEPHSPSFPSITPVVVITAILLYPSSSLTASAARGERETR